MFALSVGEPAGIGPDLLILIQDRLPKNIRIYADKHLLKERAHRLGLPFLIESQIEHIALNKPVIPGTLDVSNASYVLNCLEAASQACIKGEARALVTGPVHKGIIRDAGFAFTGHTEWLRDYCQVPEVVMLLVHDHLRVALATTHIALKEVSDTLTTELLLRVLSILHQDLKRYFGIEHPRIAVCGLNPHAGEQGHFGDEEARVIVPAILACQSRGFAVFGPVSADTAFTPEPLKRCDVVLTLFHDQGLPVIKFASFGHAVNVTLGLPFLRTSVDHGTALELAGTPKASPDSLLAAIQLADQLC
jgi:4-hydroxythreonine-4-phosphate dehydrogenase